VSNNRHRLAYKHEIAKRLGVDAEQVFLFWKGRVAFYALLKAYGIQQNDEVIIPAFTCVVVPNAIIYTGAKPIYADINPLTYNAEAKNIADKISSRTKLIVAQNTFGLSPDLEPVIKPASEKNISVIEDCTHGFGGTYQNKQNGLVADASFFSTQWNKPYSTGIGGFAIVRNESLIDKMKTLEDEALQPSMREVTNLKILLSAKKLLISQRLYWTAVKSYRYLSKKNIVVGSSGGDELESPTQPENFLKAMSELQAKVGAHEIKNVQAYNTHRILLATEYTKSLHKIGITPPYQPDYATHTFLKYPLLVNDRSTFMSLAEKNEIELGDWFLSPIHPVEKNFERWNYNYGSNPTAEKISAHIINLPTGPHIDNKQLNRVIEFIRRNRSLLYNNVNELLLS